jgi:hypothetical protein
MKVGDLVGDFGAIFCTRFFLGSFFFFSRFSPLPTRAQNKNSLRNIRCDKSADVTKRQTSVNSMGHYEF